METETVVFYQQLMSLSRRLRMKSMRLLCLAELEAKSSSLVFVVIISAVFILCMKETEPQKAKKKAKKVITKKGW